MPIYFSLFNSRVSSLSRKFDVISFKTYRQTSFYCAPLDCALQMLPFFYFTHRSFVTTPHQASLSEPTFPTECAHFVSLCHVLVTLEKVQNVSLLLCYGDLIFDAAVITVLGCQEPHPHDSELSGSILCVFQLLHAPAIASSSSLSSGPSYALRQIISKLRQLITLP